MKAANFDYVAVDSVEAAVERLAEAAGDCSLLAGGQTLMPLLALRMATPSLVIDINRVEALKGVSRPAGSTRIAAMSRQAEILLDPTVAQHVQGLSQASRLVGHHQTRNRGTIGGSVAFAEPAAEYPAVTLTLGAVIEACSATGTREIAAEDFFLGPYTTSLQPDEIIVAIRYPDLPPNTTVVVQEVARRPGDFALVGLVAALSAEGGKISHAAIGWFGMGPTPLRSRKAEQALVGQSLAGLDLKGAAELAVSETDPFDDDHASASYRRSVGRTVFARVLGGALQQGAPQ